jgi:hypothetical protein
LQRHADVAESAETRGQHGGTEQPTLMQRWPVAHASRATWIERTHESQALGDSVDVLAILDRLDPCAGLSGRPQLGSPARTEQLDPPFRSVTPLLRVNP